VRRGAAWPAERPRSRLVVGERKHGWASQRAVARRGGQGGPDAGCAVVTVSAFLSGVRCPVSGVRCPVSGASVRCPAGPVQVTGVRCGRLSVQVSSVRPPASVVSDGNEVVGRGGGAGSRTAGMAGVGVIARRVHDGASSARGWSLALEAGTGRAEPAAGRLRLGRRCGRWLGSGPGRPGGRPGEAGCTRGSPVEVVGGDHAAWFIV
jgi:hypothetical protein